MSALITGAGGFIGRALACALRSSLRNVAEFDNNSRHGGPGPVQDIRDPGAVSDAVAGASSVWHLAAINGTRNFYGRPWEVTEVQVRGTLNVIDACVSHGVRDLVLFSSSEAYQSPPVIPTPEDVPLSIPDITNPRYSYAVGKIAAEAMCWHSAIEKVVVVRPHQVFGPNAGYDHVIPQFITRMARTPIGGTFDIFGATTRSFIYIDDFVEAVLKIWEHTEKTPGRVREIYHVGTEDMQQITAVAGQIARLMGKHDGNRYLVKWKTHDGPAGGTRSRCPDTRKVRALGWEPRVSFGEGLKRTVEAYLAKEAEWPA